MIFYSKGILWANLLISLDVFFLLLVLKRLQVNNLFIYILGGLVMWYLFGLANPSIVLETDLSINYVLGIVLGLVVGKPVCIFVFSYFGVRSGVYKLPQDLNWKAIFFVGFLAGIGFTMSIFITLLAFEDSFVINNSKLAI